MMAGDPAIFDRTELLLGQETLSKLRSSHLLILGLGGVGAFACEAAARAGVGALTIVDGDRIEPSNINRQLSALHSTLGKSKCDILRKRILDINPDAEVIAINEFISGDAIGKLLETHFDYAIDAIDSLTPKVDFLAACSAEGMPVVSSMGAGGRIDPTQIRLADISKTHDCALARAVRTQLRKRYGITKGIQCVFSCETVPAHAVRVAESKEGYKASTVGTISYMPAIFGLYAASVALRGIAGI